MKALPIDAKSDYMGVQQIFEVENYTEIYW